jgi:hypothetical protein
MGARMRRVVRRRARAVIREEGLVPGAEKEAKALAAASKQCLNSEYSSLVTAQ